jgi:xanthine dehydrogenase accessory factor
MIGSAGKTRQVREHLLAAGHAAEALARVHTPIGIPIGSHTPMEIAISILAELVAVRSGVMP